MTEFRNNDREIHLFRQRLTAVVVFVLLAGMAVIGWRIYGVEALAPAPVKTPPPRSMPLRQLRP